MNKVQSDHPIPLYSQIKNNLRMQIINGAYQPLDRIPSESELTQKFGVSRITVRQALGDLEKENLIFKVPGKGSFVSGPQQKSKSFQELSRLQGFAEAMSPQGHETWNKLLGIKTVPAYREVATRLDLNEGSPVTEIRRIRYLDHEPLSLDITYLPFDLGQKLVHEDLATRDIFIILENDYGIALGYADLSIEAASADNLLANLLHIAEGNPILRIERLTHTHAGKPIDFEYLYCRSDNFQFRMRVQRNHSSGAKI